MQSVKEFPVFGEKIEVLVSSEMGHGLLTVIQQTCLPMAGPPPHLHEREDEFFTVIEGEFEILEETTWHRVSPGESVYSPRGTVHSFRYIGEGLGKIVVAVSPAGLDQYLEQLSPLALPQDEKAIVALSDRQGIKLAPGIALTEWFELLEQKMGIPA